MRTPLLLPNGDTIARPDWMPTPEEEKERLAILAAQFFLVRIGGNGDVWRCRNCGGKHRYLTLRCIEQPFSGLTHGLYAYYKTVGAFGAEAFMSPPERARYDRLGQMFEQTSRTPDLATSHPQLARQIGTAEHESDVGAFSFVATEPSAYALGILEPITRDVARRLARRINATGIRPAFMVPGLFLEKDDLWLAQRTSGRRTLSASTVGRRTTAAARP